MKTQHDFTWRAVIAISLVSVLTAFLAQFSAFEPVTRLFPYGLKAVVPVLTGVTAALFVAYWFRTLDRNPFPLKVALLGAPQSGKTVFLTVLFRELQVFQRGPIRFQPYGRETIETVSDNLSHLSAGYWLKPTSEDSVFFFRANAVIGTGIFKRKYTVEIGDYAGERIGEFDTASERWLHRTEYFKYAVGCDIVFLAVDGGILVGDDGAEVERIQLRLIAALQVLIEEKGVPSDSQLRIPVGLLILKSDLIRRAELSDQDVLLRLNRLVDVCRQRCRHFQAFFVSAIGMSDNPLGPPSTLQPIDVVEPMVWALRQVRS